MTINLISTSLIFTTSLVRKVDFGDLSSILNLTMSLEALHRAVYSSDQIDQYLRRISFPIHKYPNIEPKFARTDIGLAYLEKLMRYQLSAIPFENLSLHYSQHPCVSLNDDDIFRKLVQDGRGGYCMELNFLFGKVLRTSKCEIMIKQVNFF